jgi:hypothetical protein
MSVNFLGISLCNSLLDFIAMGHANEPSIKQARSWITPWNASPASIRLRLANGSTRMSAHLLNEISHKSLICRNFLSGDVWGSVLVAPQGFEPRSSESESLVLPLNEGATG